MTKLTTERLEELANATTPSVKYVGREIIAMARQLLAYEQAAKEVACWGVTGQRGRIYPLPPQTARMDSFPLYRVPVLPKQPELVENLKKVMNSWLAMEPKLAYQPEFTDVMMLLDAEPAPAQPVIPEQTEREKIRREHAKWSDATFGNVGPVGPLKHLSKEALEAAADPSDPLEWADMQFLLWDAQRRMGISDDFITKAMIEKLEINKKRQWPEPKDGEPRLHIKKQLAQPVSEPYKLPDGWVMVPQQIFLDASDIESICSQCGDGHKSGYGDFTDGLLWVGDIQCDNGTIMHGLHISSSDYQEEGGLTLAEFKAPVQEPK